MLNVLDNSFVTTVEVAKKKRTVVECSTFKDVIALASAAKDDYTTLRISATYEGAFTIVRMCPDDDKTEMIFQTYATTDGEDPRAIVEMYKRSKNHKCAMRHVKYAFSMVCAFADSFVTMEHEKRETLFNYLVDTPLNEERLFHEELVECAWQPMLVRNCLDERDLEHWR
jgi:hypothetical protein